MPRDKGRSCARWILLGVALTALSYPPAHWFVPTFVGLSPAVVLILRGLASHRPLRSSLVSGFLFGLLTNLITLSWLPIAMWRIQPAMTWAGAAVPVALGVSTAVVFGAAHWLGGRTGLSQLWIFPPLWILVEWLREQLGPLAFPWLGLAASLSHYPAFLQLAEVVGSLGVGWLIAVANSALALAWIHRHEPRGRRLATRVVGAILVVGALGLVRMRTLEFVPAGTVAVVQPNVGYRLKWDRFAQDSMVAALIESTREVAGTRMVDLVAWPELAIPDLLQHRLHWREWLDRVADDTNTPVVVGALTEDAIGGQYQLYNAAFLIRPRGHPGQSPVYRKRHLVPLVEWFPHRGSGRPAGGSFGGYAAGDSGVVLRIGTLRVSLNICFEAAFAETVRRDRRQGAQVIVNLSNDAWLAGTAGPWQNPAHLVLRAIENRVGIVRAANTGPSQIIRPDGVVEVETPYGTTSTLTGPVSTTAVLTPFTRFGDWVGVLALVWVAGLGWLAARPSRAVPMMAADPRHSWPRILVGRTVASRPLPDEPPA